MKVIIASQEKITVVKVEGTLDASTLSAFKKATYPLIEKGNSQWVLDASSLQFVDSMGLGVLISMLRKVRARPLGDFKMAGLSADVRSIFEITRLHRLFDCTPDVKTALQHFS